MQMVVDSVVADKHRLVMCAVHRVQACVYQEAWSSIYNKLITVDFHTRRLIGEANDAVDSHE